MKRHLRYALELLFVPIAAAIARWPPVARLEAWLRGLPPWGALLAFVAPSLLVIPIKLSAVWFAFHHRYGLSALSVVVGKMLATALVARLYQVLRPTLVKMPWYLSAETWLFDWRDRLYAFVRALPAWQRAKALVQRVRIWVRELVFGASSR